MKTYQATKIIKAKKMTLGEYVRYKAENNSDSIAVPPQNHDLETEGYLVGYPGEDGRSFNGSLEGNCQYISWSPRNIFESVHREYPPVKQSGMSMKLTTNKKK